MEDLNAAAAAAKAAGDPRSCDQIRADEAFRRLSRGAFGAPATSESAGPDSAAATATARPQFRISLTMSLATWLGLASQPAQLDGYGTVAPALARQIAADAARDHPRTTTWRCVVTDDDKTVVGIGEPFVTPAHDAPLRVAALVRTAEGVCVFPGCSTPARRCDLDHRKPFPDGATCTCNLQGRSPGASSAEDDRSSPGSPRATRRGRRCASRHVGMDDESGSCLSIRAVGACASCARTGIGRHSCVAGRTTPRGRQRGEVAQFTDLCGLLAASRSEARRGVRSGGRS